jgi:UDP-glucose:(heptosyl)LPS alpha-1,3-glucosyltransferase
LASCFVCQTWRKRRNSPAALLLNIFAGLAELRLAVVSPFVDRSHGTERALAELLERLARDFHCEIHLYAERVEDLALADPQTPRSAPAGFLVWHKVPSVPGPHLLKFLGWVIANSFLRWWHRFFRRLSFDLVLSPGINCMDADVIIVHVVFQRLRELSLEQTAGDTPQPRSLRDMHRRAYYALLTSLERRLYCDPKTSLAAVSQRTAGLLAQYFGRRDVRVIPNGVDTREFHESNRIAHRRPARRRLQLLDTDFVLLLIGNDWRVKGVPAILEAMAQLPALHLHLVVVGGDAAEVFREQAMRLDVLDRCHWEPPRPAVIDFYAAADVYVSPSLEDSFGLPVAEAMACGLPVITSSQAGISALVRDGVDGFVLRDPQDTQHLASIIQQLYSQGPFREGVAEAAATTARDWTWDRSAVQLWALLQDTLTTKNSHHSP